MLRKMHQAADWVTMFAAFQLFDSPQKEAGR